MKKVLVTGGTGFIGSHTAVALMQHGFEVVIADNLSNSRIEALDGIKKITGTKPQFFHTDLSDRAATAQFFDKAKPDAVIHFAALKAVGESVDKPLEYYRNNINSLLNLLEQCREHRTNHFVFSSSCTVYGEPDAIPIDEHAPRKEAESPYGNTKRIGEDIIRDATRAFSIRAISLRYFNPVGAHPSAFIGEYPLGTPNNLMPVMTQTAIGKRKSFEVFGSDYNTPDGSCIRDYIHVMDLAEAHVAALERLDKNNSPQAYEVFNVGTGYGISVLQMVKSFERITGVKLNYKISGRRAGDIEKIYAGTAIANKELNWSAKYSLDDMVTSAWKWEQALAGQGKIS